MSKVRSWVGLDVHAAKVVACVVDAESGEMTVHRLRAEPAKVVVAIAWKAQQRLYRLWRHYDERNKRRTIAAVAIARRLTGFCWAIVNTDTDTDT